MKKKENFWQLLKRLDQQAGEFNIHLAQANKYFDQAAHKTKTILERQEKELHETIARVRKALKKLKKEKEPQKKKKDNHHNKTA